MLFCTLILIKRLHGFPVVCGKAPRHWNYLLRFTKYWTIRPVPIRSQQTGGGRGTKPDGEGCIYMGLWAPGRGRRGSFLLELPLIPRSLSIRARPQESSADGQRHSAPLIAISCVHRPSREKGSRAPSLATGKCTLNLFVLLRQASPPLLRNGVLVAV